MLRFLSGLFLVLLFTLGAGVVARSAGLSWFTEPGPLQQETAFLVPRGSSMSSVADDLEREGIVTSAFWFGFFTRLRDESGRLQAGEFLIPAHSSPEEVLLILTDGQAIARRVTLPEGWTTWQILQRVAAQEELEGELTLTPTEGTLLPETYLFERGTTRDQMIERMQAAMQETLAELWEARAPGLPFDTPEEAVILASIVERETGQADERGLVASVMVNRINRGMRLQMDSTIEYGLTLGEGTLGRGLRRSEIDDGSNPYNTYRFAGLPPGPIANPGRAAIEAVLNPAETNYLYFVADGTGGHAFAETLDEHNRNVAAWRALNN